MVVNASINVYTWLTNFEDPAFQKVFEDSSCGLLPLLKLYRTELKCRSSRFLHTISEQDETDGVGRCGVSILLSVQTQSPENCFRFLKLFESLAAVIDMLPEPIQKCEFVLTEA